MKLTLAALLLAALAASTATAHHSFAGTYAIDQNVTVEGTIAQFVIRNPHSFVILDIVGTDGRTVQRGVEWGGVTQLKESGVEQSTLKAGDRVTVSGAPALNPNDNKILMRMITRPADGWTWAGRVGQDRLAQLPNNAR